MNRDNPIERWAMHIGGHWTDADGGARFDSLDPFTRSAWASVPHATTADVGRAVDAAHTAFTCGAWPKLSASARGALLVSLADVILANVDRLAAIEVRDNGKVLAETRAHAHAAAAWFRYFGGMSDKLEGAVTPAEQPGLQHMIRYEPLGVVAAITPWNAPLLLAAFKLAPALAAGCTVVIKPSEHAPVSTLLLAALCLDAGLPPGVVNVVTGFADAGAALVVHPRIAKVAFTGGETAGRAVYQAAAGELKPVSLELGGKTPAIVFADANLDAAVAGTVHGIFAGAGQTCMATSRLLVEASVHDEVVERLVAAAGELRLDDPALPDTDMGPLANGAQVERTLAHIANARADGARCLLGGARASLGGRDGWFVEPTIFADVQPTMRIAREEVFGPVLAVLRFDTEDNAVQIANDSPYGLAAAVWTGSLRRATELPARLRAGTVWINACRVTSPLAPFGGFGRSGIGREGGQRNIYDYCSVKSVFLAAQSRRAA